MFKRLSCALAFGTVLASPALRTALAQSSGGDPTPVNQFFCEGVFTPPANPAYAGDPGDCYPATRDLNYGPWALHPIGSSWIYPTQTMGAAGSPRDRRPGFFLQCWNGSWTTNPFGLVDWWVNWTQGPNGWEDLPRDLKGLDPLTLAWTTQANGVPDQFEELFFRFETMWNKGVRRFILKLPGGVPYGKAWYTYIGNTRYDYYIGQNQPMNQWGMMPEWKKDWFRGYGIDSNGNHIPVRDLRNPNLPAEWVPWLWFASHFGDGGDPAGNIKLEQRERQRHRL